MTGLDMGILHEFSAALDALVKDAPELQKELHTELASELKRALDGCISSAVDDSHGHVRSWQEKHVGSLGGYAAVRPAKNSVSKGDHTYRMGELTAYLERGHRTRQPSGKANYRPRLKNAYVNGRHFYSNTCSKIERMAINRAERLVNTISERLEGAHE